MKGNNQETEVKNVKSTVSSVDSSNDIFNEDNLFTGSEEKEEMANKIFEDWYKVKIQGKVSSYKIHEDGSLQLKFVEIIEKTVDGFTYEDYEDKSIRIRKLNGDFTKKEVDGIIGKNIECINVEEKPQYKKLADGEYDFNRIEKYYYSANNIKQISKDVKKGFEIFKVFEMNVKNIIPCVEYNQRKRKQEINKNNAVLMYDVSNDTLSTLHKITVEGLSLNNAKKLVNKDIIVLDLTIKGKNYYCSKIKQK